MSFYKGRNLIKTFSSFQTISIGFRSGERRGELILLILNRFKLFDYFFKELVKSQKSQAKVRKSQSQSQTFAFNFF